MPASGGLLLAVSGGLDSMVLLDFFRRFGRKKYALKIAVAHLDHGLRPESAADALWLAERCQAWGIPCFSARREVLAQQTQSSQSSLEALAREARYHWLQQVAQEQGFETLVTAHTASDQLETVLMHWIRGGISGLQGMRPRRRLTEQVTLMRPLLGVSRSEISAYAQAHELSWREDQSNQSAAFFRNRLRQELIPWLLAENPALERALVQQSEIWHDEQDWLQAQARVLYAQGVRHEAGQQWLESRFLLAQPRALQRCLLKEILTVYLGSWKIFTSRHLEAIRTLAAGPGAKSLDLPADLRVSKLRGQLIFAAAAPTDANTDLSQHKED